MAQTTQTNQIVVGSFPDQQSVEKALQVLQEQGISLDRVSMILHEPTVPETDARHSGGQGAIAGALCGGIVGLLMSSVKVGAANSFPVVEPTQNIVGFVLAGSLIGAVGVGLIMAMMGVNVRPQARMTEASAFAPDYLLLAQYTSEEELSQVREVLQPLMVKT